MTRPTTIYLVYCDNDIDNYARLTEDVNDCHGWETSSEICFTEPDCFIYGIMLELQSVNEDLLEHIDFNEYLTFKDSV